MKAHQAQQVLMLESYLDKHDELLKQSRAVYDFYHKEKVEDLPFQRNLVNQALSQPKIWTAELATGIGKSVIGAMIALERVKDGPVIYVCPSAAALGNRQSGIINKFSRTFKSFGRPDLELGETNDLSRANDVSFVTPRVLYHLLSTDISRTHDMFRRASCFIIDEAHHFPDDVDNDLRVYGEIYEVADRLVRNGLTVAMTGTWERLDRMKVMGKVSPDARITVQDAVNLKRCPEVYGVQVITDVVANKATSRGDLYDMHLTPNERKKYLDGVSECMKTVYRRYPVPFAAFTRTQSDANELAARYNSSLGSKGKELAVMTAETPMSRRLQVIESINAGNMAGYVTCAVGEEAVDLPSLEVVHLVRRTRSHVRNMQSVGRTLRLHQGKKRSLIVDYQTMMSGIVDRFLGISLTDLAKRQESNVEKVVNGGPLVCQQSYQFCSFGGITMDEERALVCKHSDAVTTSADTRKKELIAHALAGGDRPSTGKKQTEYMRLLGHAFYNYTSASQTSFDKVFYDRIAEVRPDWLTDKNDPISKKALLLSMAVANQPVPTRIGPNRALGMALHNYTSRFSRCYDPEFVAQITKANPNWLVTKKSQKEAIDQTKNVLREMARAGLPRPQRPLVFRFMNYATKPSHAMYDKDFAEELKSLRPDWFTKSSAVKKKKLVEWAKKRARRPKFSSEDNEESSLAHMLYKYTTPGKKCYDPEFVAELTLIRPEWF